jgi:hypothetical protein
VKNFLKASLVSAVALFALTASSHAQTLVFNGAGSSALFLELGEAASASSTATPAGLGLTCIWTAKSGASTGLSANDSVSGVENGQSWIAWNPGTAGNNSTCGTTNSSTTVYAYLQTDSVVGNRLLFNGGTVTLGSSAGNTADLIYSTTGTTIGTETATLPTGVSGLFSSHALNVAGTDIRPEDALFATVRAHTTGGLAVVTGSQYLGLGYPYATSGSASTIDSYYSSSTFNVTSFSLPSSYNVYTVGAAPVVFAVIDTNNTGVGFGANNGTNFKITDINSGVLANFLDGSYSRTQDVSGLTTGSEPVTVLIREPLSGTYNTVEYNIANTLENQTSQDVGLNQRLGQKNIAGGAVFTNPLNIATASGGARRRVIGTGEALNALFDTGSLSSYPSGSVLGYAFWSVGNFKNAYHTYSWNPSSGGGAHYLTVDAVDPLQTNYTNGEIPTAANGLLGNINFQNVIDGKYPVWSFLRLVSVGSSTGASNLATTAQNFVSFGTSTSQPDFVPINSTTYPAYNSIVVRSHFAPPGQSVTASNGTGTTAEAGGDVGGVVYTIVGDRDYIADFQSGLGVAKTGETGLRR